MYWFFSIQQLNELNSSYNSCLIVYKTNLVTFITQTFRNNQQNVGNKRHQWITTLSGAVGRNMSFHHWLWYQINWGRLTTDCLSVMLDYTHTHTYTGWSNGTDRSSQYYHRIVIAFTILKYLANSTSHCNTRKGLYYYYCTCCYSSN